MTEPTNRLTSADSTASTSFQQTGSITPRESISVFVAGVGNVSPSPSATPMAPKFARQASESIGKDRLNASDKVSTSHRASSTSNTNLPTQQKVGRSAASFFKDLWKAITSKEDPLTKARTALTKAENTYNALKNDKTKNPKAFGKAAQAFFMAKEAVMPLEKAIIKAAVKKSPMDIATLLQTYEGRTRIAVFLKAQNDNDTLPCLNDINNIKTLIKNAKKGGKDQIKINEAYQKLITKHIINNSRFNNIEQRDQSNQGAQLSRTSLIELSRTTASIDDIQKTLDTVQEHLHSAIAEEYSTAKNGGLFLKQLINADET